MTNEGGPDPLVNMAVCGDFAHLQLVPHLARQVCIGRIYYAARVSRNAESLGLAAHQAVNAFVKEYLVQGHTRYLKNYQMQFFYPKYDWLWEATALLRWKPCDVLHSVLLGNSQRILTRARGQGSKILGHPVMTHPAYLNALMAEEYDRLGLPVPPGARMEEILREIAMCDHLFCHSHFIEESYIANGFPAEKIDVIHLPTKTRNFKPRAEPPRTSPFRVVCVGQICPRKGQLYLVQAWKKLQLPDAELVLVGTMHAEMEKVLAPYEGVFRHVPRVDDLPSLLHDTSIFVLPSIEDGAPMVVTEALSCGVPVITTNRAGTSELIRQGENGYVIEPRDIEAMCDLISRIYHSEDERARLRANALETQDHLPRVEDTVTRLAAVYRKMVGN